MHALNHYSTSPQVLCTLCCLLQFWKENAEKFEEKDFQILRVLLKLLEASRETRTLAVGCHDLGMFITHHPHGRSIVVGRPAVALTAWKPLYQMLASTCGNKSQASA